MDKTLLPSKAQGQLKPGYKKWAYSLKNKDGLNDSGCASVGLKVHVVNALAMSCLLLLWTISGKSLFAGLLPVFLGVNMYINRDLIWAFFKAGGLFFGMAASAYYTLVYSYSVGIGAAGGILKYFMKGKAMRKSLLKSRRPLSGSTSCYR